MHAVTARVPMRFRDLDAYGHVNNSTMFNYLEEARIVLFGDEFYKTSMQDLQFLVQKASCTYLRPLLLQSSINVQMRITRLQQVRFSIEYSIQDEQGIEYAKAETTMACFDPQRNRPTKIPEWFLRQFQDP